MKKQFLTFEGENIEVVKKIPNGFKLDPVANKNNTAPNGYLWLSDYETSALIDRQFKLIKKEDVYGKNNNKI